MSQYSFMGKKTPTASGMFQTWQELLPELCKVSKMLGPKINFQP